jgi:hypothetical protein
VYCRYVLSGYRGETLPVCCNPGQDQVRQVVVSLIGGWVPLILDLFFKVSVKKGYTKKIEFFVPLLIIRLISDYFICYHHECKTPRFKKI